MNASSVFNFPKKGRLPFLVNLSYCHISRIHASTNLFDASLSSFYENCDHVLASTLSHLTGPLPLAVWPLPATVGP